MFSAVDAAMTPTDATRGGRDLVPVVAAEAPVPESRPRERPGGRGAAAPRPRFGRRLLKSPRPDTYLELSPDVTMVVLGYLDASARHLAAAAPVCRAHRRRVRDSRDVWYALCAASPWRVAPSALAGLDAAALRRYHSRILQASAAVRVEAAPTEDVARVMAEHAGVAGVQRECLEVLGERLHDEGARGSAIRAGATAAVVAALNRFPADARIAKAALHCVVFLARPLGGAEGMVFHRGMAASGSEAFLGKRGGVAAVIATMRRHGDSPELAAVGCWSLVNLALNHDQKLALLRCGGLGVLLEAMRRHGGAREVQFRALFALINLVIPEAGAAQPPKAAGAVVDAVLAAIARFPDSEKLVRCGCLVLHNLSLDEANAPCLLDAGVVAPLLRAADSHADADVQRSALSTLRRLGVDFERPAAAFPHGGGDDPGPT